MWSVTACTRSGSGARGRPLSVASQSKADQVIMDRILHQFVSALRGSGVRVSPPEGLDAMEAVRLMGYGDRAVFKAALGCALAKSLREREIFDVCFDLFFSVEGFSREKGPPDLTEDLQPDHEDHPLTAMLLAGDASGLSISMGKAAEEVDMGGIRFFTQKSLYVQRILKNMGLEGVDQDIRRLESSGPFSRRQKAAAIREARSRLYERVRDHVERQYTLHAKAATEEILERYLRNISLSNLEQRDYGRMQEIVRRLAKRLNDRHSRRRKVAARGSLDLKKTLRGNVAYQGVIFEPKWRRKKTARPDLMVLCDVSRSVETVSRFMLLFVYSLNEAIARIRSFIFCSNLIEVSSVFEMHGVEEAVELLSGGQGIGIQRGRTDYGAAFQDFRELALDDVTRKTTILILGDARNNYGDPRSDILKTLHDRSRRVIWLNPEPPAFYGSGDSEMKRYFPYCSLVRQCSTVRQLERAVDDLLRYRNQ